MLWRRNSFQATSLLALCVICIGLFFIERGWLNAISLTELQDTDATLRAQSLQMIPPVTRSASAGEATTPTPERRDSSMLGPSLLSSGSATHATIIKPPRGEAVKQPSSPVGKGGDEVDSTIEYPQSDGQEEEEVVEGGRGVLPPQFSESFDRGIIIFAYNPSPTKVERYVKEAAESVASLRVYNKTVRVALATNRNVTEVELHAMGFSDMMHIISDLPDHEEPQWWTRTRYLLKSPYDKTIQVRCVFCNSFQERLKNGRLLKGRRSSDKESTKFWV